MDQSVDHAGGGGPQNDRRTGGLFSLILLIVLAASCWVSYYAFKHWWLPPVASVEGVMVDRLMNTFFYLTAIVFVGVHIALIIFVYRFTNRGGQRRAVHWHDSLRLELTWTIVPTVILFGLTIASGFTWATLQFTPQATDGTEMEVEVTAYQFGWMFRYPGEDGEFGLTSPEFVSGNNRLGIDPNDEAGADDIVVMSEMYLPVGVVVNANIESRDVIHSFFVPQYRFKQDAVPGRTTTARFTPSQTGEVEIACAELCGVGHYVMRGVIQVVEQEEFDAWMAERIAEKAAKAEEAEAAATAQK